MAEAPAIGKPYFPTFKTKIQPVTVVPILAPRINPNACFNVKSEALTNPIAITVLTEDD